VELHRQSGRNGVKTGVNEAYEEKEDRRLWVSYDGEGPEDVDLAFAQARPTYIPDYDTPRFRLTPAHSVYVKIAEGCNHPCSFCIIPHVRPNLASRPIQHILDEVRRLVDRGYREVVLTGIHLGHYGVEWNRNAPKEKWVRLSHLVRRIAELPGDFRVRL